MKHKKNKILVLLVSCYALFFACATLDKEKKNSTQEVAFVEVVNIESEYITNLDTDKKEQVREADSKFVKKLMAHFSPLRDTISIYNLNTKHLKNTFVLKKIKLNKLILMASKSKDTIPIQFVPETNSILVDSDTYWVNAPYYNFLKLKILNEGSIMAVISLIKDGYGDYCNILAPLVDYKWTNDVLNKDYKIHKVSVKSINYQSFKNEKYSWNVTYTGKNANGERFKRTFVEETDKHIIYEIDGTVNERSAYKKVYYKNKKTGLDSIIGNWYTYSKNIEYQYTNYQSKLQVIEMEKKPKDLQSMFKLYQH